MALRQIVKEGAVKICTYMLLRKLYSENPHNSHKLFELDTEETMERCVKYLSAQPKDLVYSSYRW